MSFIDSKTFHQAASIVSRWRRPLLISHTKPDGDALGSLTAVRCFLEGQGAKPLAVLWESLSPRYAMFRSFGDFPVYGVDVLEQNLSEMDGVIVLDTCAFTQLEPIVPWLKTTATPKLVVDHHVTRDELKAAELIDESAAATCLILYEWAKAVGWPIDAPARQALFVGIATDTGWFRHSNTDARTLGAAAELSALGVAPHKLHQELFLGETPAPLKLLTHALSSLTMSNGGRLAMMTLTQKDFQAAKADPSDTENIVNEPLRIGAVAVSVLMVEENPTRTRVSFRSKPPLQPSDPDVDVAAIAQTFGGGGHRRAAAARVNRPIDEVRQAVEQHVERVFSRA